MRDIDDLFEMRPASASIQGLLSIGFLHRDFRSTFKIYERVLAIACPILLVFVSRIESARLFRAQKRAFLST